MVLSLGIYRILVCIEVACMSQNAIEASVEAMLDLNEKIRVLHVDDESALLKITKECLESEGQLKVDAARAS